MRVSYPLMLLVFAVTLFVSATLLFLVQPMVGKMILPLLGGTPAVWNTCMVFFQALLLAGYSYAHVSTAWLGVRRQAIVHLGLLLVPALALPIVVNKELAPQGEANPVFGVLFLLLVTCGLPFFVVAASAPLLQKWFADTGHPAAKDPYFLYGASNLGSMLALISYPLLLEPYSKLALQSILWTAGYGLLALLTALCAFFLWRSPSYAEQSKTTDHGPGATDNGLRTSQRLYWIALAFVPSSLMLGVTTYITTDVAAIPLLWVLPLSLYLLSFILVFSRLPAIIHTVMRWALPLVILFFLFTKLSGLSLGAVLASFSAPLPASAQEFLKEWAEMPIVDEIVTHLLTLFVVAVVCHGELARSRPSTTHLTEFYLLMSLGGVLGGIFNGLVAPLVFNSVLEYPLALILACLLMRRLGSESRTPFSRFLGFSLLVVMGLPAVGLLAVAAWKQGVDPAPLFEPGRVYNTLTILLLCLFAVLGWSWFGKGDRATRVLDILLPAVVGMLLAGMIWGLPFLIDDAPWLRDWLPSESDYMDFRVRTALLRFGIPLACCLTLVRRPIPFGLSVAPMLLLGSMAENLNHTNLHQERGFFGILSVRSSDQGKYHWLIHGNINHGVQRMYTTPSVMASAYVPAIASWPAEAALTAAIRHHAYLELRQQPIAYFHPETPIGQLFASFQGPRAKKNIAITGLGTGGLSGFGRPGQKITYFEINPVVERIARDPRYFTYLRDSEERGVHIKVILGDARLQLEKVQFDRPEDKFDVVIFDAFTSDAIPIHLVNYDALQVYLSKLTEHGIVVFHISNRYVDLIPVLGRMKEEAGLAGLVQEDDVDGTEDKYSTTWVILARHEEDFGELARDWRWTRRPLTSEEHVGLWTDDYSNLLGVFKWHR